jgi:integrase
VAKTQTPKYVYPKGKKGYLYFCRRGAKPVRMHAPLGTPEFAAEYALLMRGRVLTPSRTIAKLVRLYEASDKWRSHAKNTQRSYARHFRYFVDVMGGIDPASLRRVHINEMRDALADKPTDASRKVAALSVLLEHAIDIGWMKDNPAKGVRLLKGSKPKRRPWPPDLIAKFRAEAPPLPLLIFELCLGTGQRVSDVLGMRWDAIRDGGLPVTQGKTGAELWVPFTPRLQAVLDAAPRLGATIVAQANGRPVSYPMAARDVQRVRESIGAMAFEIAALPGMTREHIKALTGHAGDDMADLYAGAAMQRARAQEAQVARGTPAVQSVKAETSDETAPGQS